MTRPLLNPRLAPLLGLTAVLCVVGFAARGLAVGEDPRSDLSALREQPGEWLGEQVRFVIQFDGEQVDFNPWLTRFGPADYRCFGAWADSQRLWLRAELDHPARTLFTRRGSAAEGVLAAGRPFDRFEVLANLREVFLGEPWLEILAAAPLTARVGETTILAAGRAEWLFSEGQVDQAIEAFEAALVDGLPEHVAAELRSRLAVTRSLADGRR